MVQQTATTVDIDAKVVQVPTVADLDVQPQRVAGTQTWRWKFFNLDQLSIGQRKQNLIYDMVNEAKADVLVEPQVRFTKKLFGERTLTISGYPATYKNFRKPSEEDLKAIRAANGTPEKVVVVGDSAHIITGTDDGVTVTPVRTRNRAGQAQDDFTASTRKKSRRPTSLFVQQRTLMSTPLTMTLQTTTKAKCK